MADIRTKSRAAVEEDVENPRSKRSIGAQLTATAPDSSATAITPRRGLTIQVAGGASGRTAGDSTKKRRGSAVDLSEGLAVPSPTRKTRVFDEGVEPSGAPLSSSKAKGRGSSTLAKRSKVHDDSETLEAAEALGSLRGDVETPSASAMPAAQSARTPAQGATPSKRGGRGNKHDDSAEISPTQAALPPAAATETVFSCAFLCCAWLCASHAVLR